MTELTLAKAQTAVSAALAFSRAKKFNPMAVCVLDARGVLKAYDREGVRRSGDGRRVEDAGRARGGAAAFHRRGERGDRWVDDPGGRRRADPGFGQQHYRVHRHDGGFVG